VTPAIIYLDTSVIGGYFDPQFIRYTREFWKQIEADLIRPVTSILVEEEIAGAPPQVRDLFHQAFTDPEAIFDFTAEMEVLAELYLKHKIVSRQYSQDAGHVAICSVERIEYLASWNYKHLANVYRNKAFNGVNLLHGYPEVTILNPSELLQP
jgi:predicted nucleic acid-binding protein